MYKVDITVEQPTQVLTNSSSTCQAGIYIYITVMSDTSYEVAYNCNSEQHAACANELFMMDLCCKVLNRFWNQLPATQHDMVLLSPTDYHACMAHIFVTHFITHHVTTIIINFTT